MPAFKEKFIELLCDYGENLPVDEFLRVYDVFPGLGQKPIDSYMYTLVRKDDIEGLNKFRHRGLINMEGENPKIYFGESGLEAFKWFVDNYLNEKMLEELIPEQMNFSHVAILYILRRVPLSKKNRLELIDFSWNSIADLDLNDIGMFIHQNRGKDLPLAVKKLPLIAAYISKFGTLIPSYRPIDVKDLENTETNLKNFVLMLKMVEKTYPIEDYFSTFKEVEDAQIMRLLLETYDKTYGKRANK